MYENNNNRSLNIVQNTYGIKMSDTEFRKLSKFITDSYGAIKVAEADQASESHLFFQLF